MNRRLTALSLMALAGMAAPAFAQDSVDKYAAGLPGDALDPWTAGVPNQKAAYVVDLTPLYTSCGTRFGIAPLIKSSRTNPAYFGSLFSAQSISSTARNNSPLPSAQYKVWNTAGEGINPIHNNTTGTIVPNLFANGDSTQFGVMIAEFSTDGGGTNSNNVLGAVVNYDPARASRLYVTKYIAATNQTAMGSGDNSQIGVGTVDSEGNVYFRADNNNAATTGANPLTASNIFRVRMQNRNPAINNEISNAGGADAGATNWLVVNDANNHGAPQNVPSELIPNGRYIGANFLTQYEWERPSTTLGTTTAHRPGTTDHRGSVAFYPVGMFGAGTVGTGGVLSVVSGTNSMSLWGVNPDGSVNAATARTFTLPANPTDVCPAYTFDNDATSFFENYRSQVAFRGPVSQVAIGQDKNGNGLAAAMIATTATATNPWNAIVAARFNPANTSQPQWRLVAWNNTPSATGKPIKGDYGMDGMPFTGDAGEFDGVCDALDGPIGRIASMSELQIGIAGPSISAPAFDAAGNVWFLSAVALNKMGSDNVPYIDYDTALIRAVYNGASFCWDLELVLELGKTFDGKNSNTPWQVQFMEVADSNSVASGTFFSSNLLPSAWNNTNFGEVPNSSSTNLGGLVLGAKIVYDADNDGDFSDPTSSSGDPLSHDEAYNVLLYIGNMDKRCPADFNGDGFVNALDYDAFASAFEMGDGAADVNYDGFSNALDYDEFASHFEMGC
ncbi:MAG: hypothetical protein IT432_10745 [Phycisphaerales bacterium]|nr:hypothetical protein [Phycisphaerales bacterium]